jgi:hypothetical protein
MRIIEISWTHSYTYEGIEFVELYDMKERALGPRTESGHIRCRLHISVEPVQSISEEVKILSSSQDRAQGLHRGPLNLVMEGTIKGPLKA